MPSAVHSYFESYNNAASFWTSRAEGTQAWTEATLLRLLPWLFHKMQITLPISSLQTKRNGKNEASLTLFMDRRNLCGKGSSG